MAKPKKYYTEAERKEGNRLAVKRYHQSGKYKTNQKKYEQSGRRETSRLKHRYNLSKEDWDRMFEKQNGCCAICGKHQSEFAKTLGIDHNHQTGKIRGLLCYNCNRALGLFYTDVLANKLLLKASIYIGSL